MKDILVNLIKESWKLIAVLILLFFLFRNCDNNATDKAETKLLQDKINDLQDQNKTIEKHAYFLDSQLQNQKVITKTKIVEVIKYQIKDQEKYFDTVYNGEVKTDSVTALKIITDLETGKGAVKEVVILTNIVKSKDSTISNVKLQNTFLFDLNKINEQNFKIQKRKTLFWQVATVGGIIGTYLLVK